jgi:hypothetical protein
MELDCVHGSQEVETFLPRTCPFAVEGRSHNGSIVDGAWTFRTSCTVAPEVYRYMPWGDAFPDDSRSNTGTLAAIWNCRAALSFRPVNRSKSRQIVAKQSTNVEADCRDGNAQRRTVGAV